MKKDNKIDVIIPAYKAQETIKRTVASIAIQSILDDISVTIVNDCCPNGNYSEIVEMYKPHMDIREIKMEKNGGPGLARQYGVDNTEHQFFTCIDADDTFAGAISLEILRTGLTEQEFFKCASGTFIQLGDTLKHMVAHPNDMVWMFGKLYDREFINRYKIRFNETRANEDTGFNKQVQMICSNQFEQIRYIPETVYYWHNKEDSITRINDGQYALDQCFCGWTDNMIDAIEHVKKVRPFDGVVTQTIVFVMIQLYYYWIETYARMPIFKDQNWEYIKKFYNKCYRKIEDDIPDEAISEVFSRVSAEKWGSGSLLGIVPCIGIHEFLDKVKNEEYNPDHIYDVWDEMKKTEEGLQLIRNNEQCGVCEIGYTERKEKKP